MGDEWERSTGTVWVWGRRCLAVLILIAMIAGLGWMGIPAIADDGSAPRAADGTTGVDAASGLERHKRIRSNTDGTYTLNLDVKAPTDSSAEGRMPMDITMVLDVSASMLDYKGKFDGLKTAANNFIDKVDKLNQAISDPAKKHRIALVKFSGNINENLGDDIYTDDKQDTNYSQIIRHLSPDLTGLKEKITALRAAGRTQSDHAMTLAERTLQLARPDVKKAVVFFTDGAPMGPANHLGINFFVDIANSALATARRLKDNGITIYSIGLLYNASLEGNAHENMFLHTVSNNYPKAVNAFRDDWHEIEWLGKKKKVWAAAQIPENFGPGDRHAGFYKPAKKAEELHNIFDGIYNELSKAPEYKGVTITDELSQYVKQSGIVYDKAVKSGDFHKVTAGATLKFSGDQASAPVQGKDYDLWFDPSGNGKMRVEFADSYMLKARETYTLEFNVEPTQQAYDTFAQNGRAGKTGADLYNGVLGSENSDLPGNETSSGKPGFYSNDAATIEYAKDKEPGRVDYVEHPVVQVPSSTLNIVKEWQGEGAKPENLTVTVEQGGVKTPLTLKPDANGVWKTSLIVPAGEEKTYKAQEEKLGEQWVVSYKHQLESGPAEDGDTVTLPASRKSQTATITVTNRRAEVDVPPNESILVNKKVIGSALAQDFSFTVFASGDNADKVRWPDPEQTSGKIVAKDVFESRPVTAALADKITLPVPDDTSKRETYTFTIVEDGSKDAPEGWKYDDSEEEMHVTVAYDQKSKKWTATPDVKQVKFVNRYLKASALPLTGGSIVPRLLMAGAVAGLVSIVLAGTGVYRVKEPLM
ncbi:VWA domain-containing protein [Bifidobacterium sp. 64T4]|uniref:DUF7604 domain-containing protein n=1 Tax=Bifidobacterium pongonis TaxID=2834432 RepID=UPI001C5789B4|nr:VWA domain-containing protein [Bifidobacterium pongonis]MBW3095508.1 VWA domain-containing protein [Bifidobacterium pongonis]